MFKALISPIQLWLLNHNQCVGCGMPLSKGLERKKKSGETLIICRCGRGYVKLNSGKYRRARVSEMIDGE